MDAGVIEESNQYLHEDSKRVERLLEEVRGMSCPLELLLTESWKRESPGDKERTTKEKINSEST